MKIYKTFYNLLYIYMIFKSLIFYCEPLPVFYKKEDNITDIYNYSFYDNDEYLIINYINPYNKINEISFKI